MMLLHVDSSILGEASVSRRLSSAVVARWRAAEPRLEIVRRDLAAEPIAHFGGHLLAAPDAGDALARADAAVGAQALEEFLAAQVVVVGAPMYNFGIPSQLKAWIDRLAVAGRTFAYSEAGPQGLAGGKKVVIASSRGGLYAAGTPEAAADFQEPYLEAVFRFFGIDDIRFVRAEGVALGEESRRGALEAALRDVEVLAAA